VTSYDLTVLYLDVEYRTTILPGTHFSYANGVRRLQLNKNQQHVVDYSECLITDCTKLSGFEKNEQLSQKRMCHRMYI
jgi:hypothetical protein